MPELCDSLTRAILDLHRSAIAALARILNNPDTPPHLLRLAAATALAIKPTAAPAAEVSSSVPSIALPATAPKAQGQTPAASLPAPAASPSASAQGTRPTASSPATPSAPASSPSLSPQCQMPSASRSHLNRAERRALLFARGGDGMTTAPPSALRQAS